MDVYQKIQSFSQNALSQIIQIMEFSDAVAKDEKLYNLLKDLLLFHLLSLVEDAATDDEKRSFYLQQWTDINALLKDMENLYLDKKSVITQIFLKLGMKK